jgi:nucleotide-binding universal stress UspA family protein
VETEDEVTDVVAAEQESEVNDQVVAVGIDDSPQALAAARYAVRAADFRGLDLLMVHAYELPPLDVPMEQAILDACDQSARKLMVDVAAQLVIPSRMQVETVVQPDSPVVLLDRISRTVPLLVVGQDHLGWGERLRLGAVAAHVGQKAQCPVVVVPGGWRAPRTSERHPVVVALDDDTPADAVLRLAFEEAEYQHTGVVVLHASPYGRGEQSGVAAEEASLTEQVAGWKEDHPDVSVQVMVVSGDADANLVKWSRFAAVLVLGRRKRHGWSHWTHAVLRSVVKQTRSPLIVVPETYDQTRHEHTAAIT